MGMNNDVQVNNVTSVNKLRPTGKEQMPVGSKETVREVFGKGSIPAPGPCLTHSEVTHSRPSIKVCWMKRRSATEIKTYLYKQHHLDGKHTFYMKRGAHKRKKNQTKADLKSFVYTQNCYLSYTSSLAGRGNSCLPSPQ